MTEIVGPSQHQRVAQLFIQEKNVYKSNKAVDFWP